MTMSDDLRCGCDGRRRATLRCLAGLAAGALGLHTPAGAQGADIVQPRQLIGLTRLSDPEFLIEIDLLAIVKP